MVGSKKIHAIPELIKQIILQERWFTNHQTRILKIVVSAEKEVERGQ